MVPRAGQQEALAGEAALTHRSTLKGDGSGMPQDVGRKREKEEIIWKK